MTTDLSILEQRLGYTFKNKGVLETALRHSSFVNELPEKNVENNERLEFLGDSVLGLIISHLLMEQFPTLNEGDLSRLRSQLVNEIQLSDIARKIKIGPFIRLGRGESQTGGHEKNSILSDTLEALLAAIYLDGGFAAAFEVIRSLFDGLFYRVAMPEETMDFKSRVQEIVQAAGNPQPNYRIINETGPDHDKTFEAELVLDGHTFRGIGKSKKMAEQAAAKDALAMLSTNPAAKC